MLYSLQIRLLNKFHPAIRLLHNTQQRSKKVEIIKNEDLKKVQFFFLKKYLNYIGKYNEVLQKRFPTTVRLYRGFLDGIKTLYQDSKTYIQISRSLSQRTITLDSLKLRELELYYQMPRDIRKVLPTIIFSLLPFGFYLVLPLVYYLPRQTLTSHFWNLQQKAEFSVILLQNRLVYNKSIFRLIQQPLKDLKSHPCHKKWSQVLGLIGSGVQPNVQQIIECKSLFADHPYSLDKLSRKHIKLLLKLHNMHTGWFFRRRRLFAAAKIIKSMDVVIAKMGGPQELNLESLKNACLIRGLNPTNMKKEDMITWINQWIMVSNQIDKTCYSLILHCPILLGYNQPSNWLLIYRPKGSS